MAKVINHKFIFIQKIMKKFFLLLFVLLGILFITKDINFVKVKAITEIKYVEYEFNGSYNNQTDFSINDFNILKILVFIYKNKDATMWRLVIII